MRSSDGPRGPNLMGTGAGKGLNGGTFADGSRRTDRAFTVSLVCGVSFNALTWLTKIRGRELLQITIIKAAERDWNPPVFLPGSPTFHIPPEWGSDWATE